VWPGILKGLVGKLKGTEISLLDLGVAVPRRIPEEGRSGPVVSVQLTPEIAARLRTDAVADDRTVSEMLRKIINCWYRVHDTKNEVS
jgi:hypothetical protein